MTRDSFWLTLRLHRFELLTFALATLAAIGAAFIVSSSLDAIDLAKVCAADPATGATSPLCDRLREEFYSITSSQGGPVMALLNALPVVAGLVLGASVVGREVERGTTRLAWSLTPVRLPWFVARAIPLLLVLVILAMLAGLAADRLTTARYPGLDITASFTDYGARGLILAGRGVTAYGLGVLAGAVLGRELPGLVLALIVLIGVIIGASKVDERILHLEAVVIDSDQAPPGAMYLEQLLRLPDGSLVTWDQAYPQGQAVDSPQYPFVSIVVPGERYGFAATRNGGEFVLAGFGALVLGAGAAARRGPGT